MIAATFFYGCMASDKTGMASDGGDDYVEVSSQ